MLITAQMPHEPGSPYPPTLPPPLLPKPGKDNLRLQKLLKKAAKKKANVTTLQSSSFRASLSPVSEASHDQDVVPQPCPKTPGATAPPAPPALPAPPAPPAPPVPLTSLAPPIPPSPLVLPKPPQTLVPAAHSPYKPVIQHVPSPLQKKSFSFNLTEQRNLAEHFRMTTPQFGGPGPDAPKSPGSFAPISAPREVTHVSRVHIHVQPVLSPRSPAPEVNLTVGTWGNREQAPPRTNPQEWPGEWEQGAGTTHHQPSPTPQVPVAHIQPLIPSAQVTGPCPEPSSTTRLSPSMEAAAPKQVSTKIVVPIDPTHRSPGPSQHSPLPRTPSAKVEPPPVPPKPSTAYPKVAAASDLKQQPPGPSSPPRSSSPELLVSSKLNTAPGREVPKAVPTPTLRTHFSGWTRLKKQLIVVPEVPPFPEPKGAETQPEQASKGPHEPATSPSATSPSAPRPLVSRATKMWDAVLYHMSVAKGGNQPEDTKAPSGGLLGRGSFLPFLHRPRFDARKLREMAAQPPAKVNTVLGASLRPSLAPKNFNRTAACWQLK